MLYRNGEISNLIVYSDVDRTEDINDRKSTTASPFKLDGATISWKSQKQTRVALSTTEAEYMTLASAGQQAVYLQHLAMNLNETSLELTAIYEENQSINCMAKNSCAMDAQNMWILGFISSGNKWQQYNFNTVQAKMWEKMCFRKDSLVHSLGSSENHWMLKP